MPIYEYVCTDCGHQLEAIQKVSEAPLVQCPACEKDSLKKKISAAAFRLKGGGWYETDFKSGNKKNVSAGDGDKSGEGEKKDTAAAKGDSSDSAPAKTETKSDSKSESKPSSAGSSD